MHRKRRELTNLLCKSFGAAWNPHQYLGLDEATREHKYQGKQRIRFKAAVHSGALCDSLNDCSTCYCMWFEEQQWLQKEEDGDDPNTIKARVSSMLHVSCLLIDLLAAKDPVPIACRQWQRQPVKTSVLHPH